MDYSRAFVAIAAVLVVVSLLAFALPARRDGAPKSSRAAQCEDKATLT